VTRDSSGSSGRDRSSLFDCLREGAEFIWERRIITQWFRVVQQEEKEVGREERRGEDEADVSFFFSGIWQ
jgi:hypothetical protein